MSRVGFRGLCFGIIIVVSLVFCAGSALPQAGKPPDAVLKNAYQEIVKAADKNGDGKLSLQECMAISKDKAKIEKDCKYWDANGDGTITEDEYVKQAKKTMR
jgi:hypothetical protein